MENLKLMEEIKKELSKLVKLQKERNEIEREKLQFQYYRLKREIWPKDIENIREKIKKWTEEDKENYDKKNFNPFEREF